MACGGPPPAASPSLLAPGHITARHPDQVCRDRGRPPAEVGLGDILDTDGLIDELGTIDPDARRRAPPWPLFEYVVHYDRWGRPVAHGPWDDTMGGETASALEGAFTRRVRPIPGGLLEGAGYRVRAVFGVRIDVDLAPPVECLPHVFHRDDMRPVGLPAGVRTQGGRRWIPEGDTLTAQIRITVGADGSVRAVEALAGWPSAVERARAAIARMTFEPALRNGVPVEGTLEQSFTFPDSSGRAPTPAPAPSRWPTPRP